jgi:hypothetical protein
VKIDPGEFRSRDLRVHELLHDVPLHDVWAIELDGGGQGRSMRDVLAVFSFDALRSANILVDQLFRLRSWFGARMGWDEERSDWVADSYVGRLTPIDRERSFVPPGTPEGPFKTVYAFDNEHLAELRNATVHAFTSLSLAPSGDGYLLFWAIYVKPVHRLTRLYMLAIEPFRRWVVYPAVIRSVEEAWRRRYGAGSIARDEGNRNERTLADHR